MSWSRRGFGRALGLLGAGIAGLARPSLAKAASQRQAAIIARTLSYERSLDVRVGSSLIMLILYAENNSRSRADADAWKNGFDKLAGVKIDGRELAFATMAWQAGSRAFLDQSDVDVVVLCSGLDADIGEILDFTADRDILSIASIPEYIDSCTLGVFEKAGKLRILVNLSAAEREGVKFSSRLLKLAEVIR